MSPPLSISNLAFPNWLIQHSGFGAQTPDPYVTTNCWKKYTSCSNPENWSNQSCFFFYFQIQKFPITNTNMWVAKSTIKRKKTFWGQCYQCCFFIVYMHGYFPWLIFLSWKYKLCAQMSVFKMFTMASCNCKLFNLLRQI